MRDTIAHLWITLSVSRATGDSSPPRGKICYRGTYWSGVICFRCIERISIPSATGEAKEREQAANGYQRVRSRDSTILTYACLPFFRNTRNSDKRFANKAPSFSFFLIVEERRSKAKTREENRGRESVRSNETIRISAAEDGRPFPSARIYTHTYIYIDGDEPFTRTTKPRLRSHRT